MIYTGIGSRQTPNNIRNIMFYIGQIQGQRGHILRSGHADGADIAFEKGCISVNGAKEIYLPWRGFNSHYICAGDGYSTPQLPVQAFEIAAKYHPAWGNCSNGAKNMHTRNVCQILGANLDTPTAGVICWTKNGSGIGGTGQALRIARGYNIPIWDLGNKIKLIEVMDHFGLPLSTLNEELFP